MIDFQFLRGGVREEEGQKEGIPYPPARSDLRITIRDCTDLVL